MVRRLGALVLPLGLVVAGIALVLPAAGPFGRARGGLEDRLRAYFRRRPAAVAPPEAIMRAFAPSELARAVRAGYLRKGMSGYWLRTEPDPGAMLVMRQQQRPDLEHDESA